MRRSWAGDNNVTLRGMVNRHLQRPACSYLKHCQENRSVMRSITSIIQCTYVHTLVHSYAGVSDKTLNLFLQDTADALRSTLSIFDSSKVACCRKYCHATLLASMTEVVFTELEQSTLEFRVFALSIFRLHGKPWFRGNRSTTRNLIGRSQPYCPVVV